MRNQPDAIILCGGFGLRLRSVTGDAPKSTASIGGRPFLELLFSQLQRHGFQRAILAVGYQAEVIRSYFGNQAFGLDLTYSSEASPLGTGGALRNAAEAISSDHAVVMNGDSYTGADLSVLTSEHLALNADVSLVVVRPDGRDDCGTLMLDTTGRVVRFDEKQAVSGTRYTNAGIYVFSRQIIYDIAPNRQISLERELFPRWLDEGKCIHAVISSGKCIDIGTPERYQAAQAVLAQFEVEANLPGWKVQ